ncbi:MAG: hypothetical protein HC829_03140 [Bacteroidales bacterium]|nr:hypothetical protein [Bacteroidales bacterium]
MTILWSAVLAAAVSFALPASSMACTKQARAEQVRGHSLGGGCAKKGQAASKTSPEHRTTYAKSARDHARSALTAGLVKPLAEKVAEIVAACGSRVISGVRHTRVAGTRTVSLHASGQAVDIRGNPACIYRHLQGWPGGYTIDYSRAQHVHISYGGREHGLRFAHGGKSPSRKARRNIQIARR